MLYIYKLTRMHSSRMRTIRSGSRLSGGGGASRGGASGGVCATWKGVLPGGVCFLGRCGIPACTEADSPVNRMTDRCKNITFATSLRTVIIEVIIQNKHNCNWDSLNDSLCLTFLE